MIFKKYLFVIAILLLWVASIAIIPVVSNIIDEQRWQRICDGKEITDTCQDKNGTRYSLYLFHPAEPEKTKVVHHEAVYGTRQKQGDCIRTNISYKRGSCALSRCRDGMYSGSAGWGACNYHGGVAQAGGPWYNYITETYVISPAWDETIVISPAKEAWVEKIVAK